MQSERALSEAVSVILIIVMILILALVVAALVFGRVPLQQKSALIVSAAANPTVSNKVVFTLFHRAGDEFYLNKSLSGMHELGIYIDNSTNSSRAQPVLGLNSVKPGTILYIYYNASKNVYRITTDSAILATNEAQTMTVCPRTLRLVDEQAKLLINKSSFYCVPTGPAPTVTSITNTTGYRGWPVIEGVVGTNFLNGASVKLNRSGAPDIPASSCTYVSSIRMNCTFNLLNRLASPANYNVVVTNPDAKTGMRANYFVLSSPAPTITSSTPATGAQAATITITNLLGTNFQPGAVVDYTRNGTRINLTNVNVLSRTQITGTLVIPSGAPSGSYGVNITNTDNGKGYSAARFTVTSNAPTVTSITNATGYRGWPVIESIVGTNFVNGATARFNRSDGAPDIPATACTFASSTRINCSFSINTGTESPPTYTIVVTNPDGKQGMRASVFTLSSAAPTITSSTPNRGLQAATVPITNLVGTNFQPGAVVVYRQGATTIPLGSVNVISRTQITGSLVIPSGAPVGSYWVNVTNPDGKGGGTAARFTVNSNAPTVTSITNATGYRGWPVIESIVGTNFVSGASVILNRTATADIPSSSCTFVSSTRMNCTFDLTGKTASPPNYNLVVTNPDGKKGMRATALTLSSPTPTITSVTPNTAARGSTVTITNLAGNYFQPGATVRLRNATQIISTDAAPTVVAITRITCQFTIPSSGVRTGTYYISVTNTDAKTGNSGNIFTIS